MKKLYIIGLAALFVFALSCDKIKEAPEVIDNDHELISEETPEIITISVSTESTNDEAETRAQIEEDTVNNKFVLNWESTDSFVMSTNGTTTHQTFSITPSSIDGNKADFTGSVPSAEGEAVTTNYIAITNYTNSTKTLLKGSIPSSQEYAASGSIASNCLLVGRADGCTVGTVDPMSFKTMNSFFKFSLKKGDAADGSSNDYTHMYVQSIKIETVADGEAIAGTFGFNKTGEWGSTYNEVTTANSSVTLNCVTATLTDGVELNELVAEDFYVAVAFGTFSKGLCVTVTVKNQKGDLGTYVRTISNNKSYDIERNKLIAMPALVVTPEDASAVTYSLIKDIANLTAGNYIMCGVKSGYQAFTGTLTKSGSPQYSCATETVSYTELTKVLSYTDAVEVTLTSTDVANQYKISWVRGATTYYLTGNGYSDRLYEDSDAGKAEAWTASDATNSILLTGATNGGIIRTATGASSYYIRSYSTTGATGLVFFKRDIK